MNTQEVNGIIKSFGAITVDKVEPALKEGFDQAQIRQEVITMYPPKKINNSLSDNPFALSEFKLDMSKYKYPSQRVTWLLVPQGTTVEKVAEVIATYPKARICRTMSNKIIDVLTDEQIAGIRQGISKKTLADYKESLLVTDKDGKAVTPTQYAQSFFTNDYSAHKNTTKANAFGDIDLRTEVAVDATVTSNEVDAALETAVQ